IEGQSRALAAKADAIQAAIRESGHTGGLAFLDADGRLVVLPGNTPADAWARHAASPAGAAGRASVPPVVSYVYRADVAAPPETVNTRTFEQQDALRASMAALEAEARAAQQRTDERLAAIRREIDESVDAAKQEAVRSVAAATADLQKSWRSLSDDLAAAR